jgi:hypothetical protein
VQDPSGARATSAVSPNTRVRGTNGFVATMADVLVFPGPVFVSGLWTIPNTRVSIAGVRVVDATSQGLAISSPGPTVSGPLVVVESDRRITRP